MPQCHGFLNGDTCCQCCIVRLTTQPKVCCHAHQNLDIAHSRSCRHQFQNFTKDRIVAASKHLKQLKNHFAGYLRSSRICLPTMVATIHEINNKSMPSIPACVVQDACNAPLEILE